MEMTVLLIVILIILIVWWALLRNARKYKPEFPVHSHEEQHGASHAAPAAVAEMKTAEPIEIAPPAAAAPVEQPLATGFGTRAAEVDSAADVSMPPVMEETVEPVTADLDAVPVAPPADQPFATDFGTRAAETVSAADVSMPPAMEETVEPVIADLDAVPVAPPADHPFATDYGQPAPVESAETEPAIEMAARSMDMPDDLEILEGIGPRVKTVLAEAGIATFAKLAATEFDDLRRILDAAGLRFLDPTTWPQQAGLAAEGRMEELKTLMDNLRGGRRAA